MQHWWNNAENGKSKYSERKPYQCQFVHHKSNVPTRMGLSVTQFHVLLPQTQRHTHKALRYGRQAISAGCQKLAMRKTHDEMPRKGLQAEEMEVRKEMSRAHNPFI